MKKVNLWSVSWVESGKEKKISCFSKRAAIHEYLDIMDRPFSRNISDLKFWKNNTDYTSTLNRFLEA